jgi:NAD(P)-dependent dehydrogenase (short-subunit alcohol dehydrogenase family)
MNLLISTVVLITGASRGIGHSTAEYLAEKGYTVYAGVRTMMEHPTIHPILLDVTQPETIHNAVQTILNQEGRIDVVINNDGCFHNVNAEI